MSPNGNAAAPEVRYGETFEVELAAELAGDPSRARIAMMRPGAFTHAFDMNQRLVWLEIEVAGRTVRANAPPDAHVAPPGHYVVFVLDADGVPSKGEFVRLPTPPGPRLAEGDR